MIDYLNDLMSSLLRDESSMTLFIHYATFFSSHGTPVY